MSQLFARNVTLFSPVQKIGAAVLWLIAEIGRLALFTAKVGRSMGLNYRGASGSLSSQMLFVGVGSVPIVLLTALFTGGVLALQSYHGLSGGPLANTQVGRLVALSMLRELGPVLAGLMLASRVGAAIAAELGTMRVTEQIDALVTLATNPYRYLVLPRILACLFMLPMLVILANTVGIFGGWMVAVHSLGLDGSLFMSAVFSGITNEDLIMGLVKAATFGLMVGLMATYHGFHAGNGAAGVGTATTRAVVYSAVAILITDYFITAVFV